MKQASRLCHLAAVTLLVVAPAAAMPAGPHGSAGAAPTAQSAPHILDVPYLPQSEDLCGGAAAAMVMRYWGAKGVYAEDFAALVDRAAHGIKTDALAAALARRSWITLVETGSAARVREELERGRPVIALIEDRPQRYHYVVIVAWAGGTVVLNDPARAPLRTLDESRFDEAWQKSGRWMLVLLPPPQLADGSARGEATLASPPPPAACASLVDEGIARATAGDRAAAAGLLTRAAAACPASSAPWRELAGLDALAQDWPASAAHAREAITRDRTDAYAWNLLATAHYVMRDDEGALRAWNRAGRPQMDLLNVRGLARTRYRVVFDAAGLRPGTRLTPDRLRASERRLRDIPAFAAARVAYRPSGDGRADADVAIVEREFIPRGVPALIGLGVAAAAERTVDASISSPTGAGDLLHGAWRFWPNRPAASVAFAAPAPAVVGGVWRIEAVRETETFAPAGIRETRSRGTFTADKWLSARLRVEGSAGVESFASDRGNGTGTNVRDLGNDRTDVAGLGNLSRAANVGGAVQLWPVSDRLRIQLAAEGWRGEGRRFGRASLDAAWTSSSQQAGDVWVARAGAQAAGDDAPPTLWPGADTGHARGVLLRAHPLLHDGVVERGVFGRRLVYGGAEWRRWSRTSRWLVRVAPAAFVDVARATRGMPGMDSRVQVDPGAGLRVSLAGAGLLRIDVAHGVRDGRTALSIGWVR